MTLYVNSAQNFIKTANDAVQAPQRFRPENLQFITLVKKAIEHEILTVRRKTKQMRPRNNPF